MGFSKVIQDKLEAERRARLSVEMGQAAALVMNNPLVDGFISAQVKQFYKGLRTAPTEDLEAWRTRIRILDDFCVVLQVAVSNGEANARSLASAKPAVNPE